MVRSRRARSRRAALDAARRQVGSWRSQARPGSGRGLVLTLIAIALVGAGFALGRFTATRSAGSTATENPAPASIADVAAPAPAGDLRGLDSPDAAAAAPDAGDLGSADLPVPVDAALPAVELPAASEGAAPIAIVIDDLGRGLEVIDTLRALGVPLTYAVLPFEPRTAAVAARLQDLGEELICHLPMEPQHGENPGPGALTAAMTAGELRDATRRALEAVPGAVGVNNHMGSALSEDRDAMAAVIAVVRKQGLFFLDSRTSAASVGYTLAREAGVPAAERKVFLDGDRAPAAIRNELLRLFALANRGEPAIAIGHPYPETLAALAEVVPRARQRGYRFARVSEVLIGYGG
jgi:polysaccharide deacetylase 2 family uncharacterized protein YibQ